MGIQIGCDFDGEGMQRGLEKATGHRFRWISGSSEITCTYGSEAMPANEAQAIARYLDRLPKDQFFHDYFSCTLQEIHSTVPTPSFAERVRGTAPAPQKMARLEFSLPASCTVILRDLLAQARFDLRDYPEQTTPAKAQR